MPVHLPEVTCPACDERFSVVLEDRTYEGEPPEYCPMCGAEMDYAECADEESDD